MRIQCDIENQIEIKKSKFICYLHRCFDEEEAKAYLFSIRKLHPDATHHCYAMIIGDQLTRSNDDGEPHGTAGLPMLETLKGHQIEDCIAVCVRYFGGTLLGTGGLIRAYGGSVSEALKQATLTTVASMRRYTITFSYDLIGKIDYFIANHPIEVLNKYYEEQVKYEFQSSDAWLEDFAEMTSGKYLPIYVETVLVETALKKSGAQ